MSIDKGFSLIEVLVAFVLLAIGMLGIANMLLLAHKANSSNYIRQAAIQSAYNIMDRIHTNRQAALNGNYNVTNLVSGGTPSKPNAPTTNCETTTCNSSQLAAYDTWYWLAQDVSQLPNGCGSVNTTTSGLNTIVTVTVQWDDSAATAMIEKNSGAPKQLIMESQL